MPTLQEKPLSASNSASRTPASPLSRKQPAQKKSQFSAKSHGERNQLSAFGRYGIGGLALFVCVSVFSRFGNLSVILGKLSPDQTFRLIMTLLVLTFCVTLLALICDVFKKTRDGKLGTLIVVLVLIALAIAAWASVSRVRNNIEKANLEAHRWNVSLIASGDTATRDSATPATPLSSAAPKGSLFTGLIAFKHVGSFEALGHFTVGDPTVLTVKPEALSFGTVTIGNVPATALSVKPEVVSLASEKTFASTSEYSVAFAPVIDCPASITGGWSYAMDNRVMTDLQIHLGDLDEFLHAGLSRQQADQCAVRLRPLIPEFAKATCRFTSNTGCKAPGFEINLTPKKEDGPTLMPK